MKKRVLAVLLAICMIAGTGVLFASAKDYKQGEILVGVDTSLSIKESGKNCEIPVSISLQSNLTLPVGTTTLTDKQIDDIFKFTKGGTTSTVSYASELSKYVKITAVASEAEKKVTIEACDEIATVNQYEVSVDFSTDGVVAKDLSKMKPAGQVSYYSVEKSSAPVAKDVKFVAKLYSATTNVRFFGQTYNNLRASEIAQTRIFVNRSSNGKWISCVADTVNDLQTGDKVVLVTYLKDKKNEDFYKFNCWVDGDEVVSGVSGIDTIADVITNYTDAAFSSLPSDTSLEAHVYAYSVAGSCTISANYVEIVDRHIISYTSDGNGTFTAFTSDREIIEGKDQDQISVLEGKDITFIFTPKEGYEVAKVIIDKGTANQKNVASFASIDLKALVGGDLSTLKALINATKKTGMGAQQADCTYTFKNVSENHTIYVEYQKATPLESPTGKDLPMVAPEGLTLANADDVMAEAKAEKEAKGEAAANAATTVPAEDGVAANGGAAVTGIVNPATGSASAIAVFAVLSVAAGAAFVTAKKKND